MEVVISLSANTIRNSVFQFLDEISSNVSKESSGLEDDVVLKEGWVSVTEKTDDYCNVHSSLKPVF